MNDLLQSQIKDSCSLALPEGLKDLMWDISREVLRAQPADLLKFITDYLAALLVTREHLNISRSFCDDICTGVCHASISEELELLGLEENQIKKVTKAVDHYFAEDPVSEGSLMMQILSLKIIEKDQIPDIMNAIRRAYLRHQAKEYPLIETPPESDMDEVALACHHTLQIYRQTCPTEEEYERAATSIQAAYRAYGVQREMPDKATSPRQHEYFLCMDWEQNPEVDPENPDSCKGSYSKGSESAENAGPTSVSQELNGPGSPLKTRTASSTSLAGSYLRLPKYKPYSAHDLVDLRITEEPGEKEHSNFDYTKEETIGTRTYTTEVKEKPRLSAVSFQAKVQTIEASDSEEIETTNKHNEDPEDPDPVADIKEDVPEELDEHKEEIDIQNEEVIDESGQNVEHFDSIDKEVEVFSEHVDQLTETENQEIDEDIRIDDDDAQNDEDIDADLIELIREDLENEEQYDEI